MNTLLPCPFCGCEARRWEKLFHPPQFGCYSCNLFMTLKNWNTRVPDLPRWRKWPEEKPGKRQDVYWWNQVGELEVAHVVEGHWYTQYCEVYPCEHYPYWLPLSAIPGPEEEEA